MAKLAMLNRYALCTLILIFSNINAVLAEPFLAGLNAIDRHHYATAFRSFKPMAEKGIAEAQNNIGFLYQNGFGVKRSYANAITWLSLIHI